MPEQEEKLWHPVLQIDLQEQLQQPAVEVREAVQEELPRRVHEQVPKQREIESPQ